MELQVGDPLHYVLVTGTQCRSARVYGPREVPEVPIGTPAPEDDGNPLGLLAITYVGSTTRAVNVPHLAGKQIANTWHTFEECTEPKIVVPDE